MDLKFYLHAALKSDSQPQSVSVMKHLPFTWEFRFITLFPKCSNLGQSVCKNDIILICLLQMLCDILILDVFAQCVNILFFNYASGLPFWI
jgi:hypothetical protein